MGKKKVLVFCVFLLAIGFLLAAISPSYGEPTIKAKSPSYGKFGNVTGKVKGVDPSTYGIITYINVEDVWWIKPTAASPWTDIDPKGKFSCNITTGGYDQYTQNIALFLAPKSVLPEICMPCYALPNIPEAAAVKMLKRGPKTKYVKFSGYNWEIKRRDFPAGPGTNYFGTSKSNVSVDKDGLHLKIAKNSKDGKWYSAEVINPNSFGYGTYSIVTNSRVDLIDPMAVLGIFTYQTDSPTDGFKEIDIEYAKWGIPGMDTNSQYVVQPCSSCPGCGNCQRYQVNLTDTDKILTHYIIWQPDKIEFRTYRGEVLVSSWIYTGTIPVPGNEKFRLNYWLFNGQPPISGQTNEVVISKFEFMDLPPWEQKPLVKMDEVPPYGDTNGVVKGHVAYVDPSVVEIAVYIKINGFWWNRPFTNDFLIPVGADGKWTCDITEGNGDENATEVIAFMFQNYRPPILFGGILYQEMYDNALAYELVKRQ